MEKINNILSFLAAILIIGLIVWICYAGMVHLEKQAISESKLKKTTSSLKLTNKKEKTILKEKTISKKEENDLTDLYEDIESTNKSSDDFEENKNSSIITNKKEVLPQKKDSALNLNKKPSTEKSKEVPVSYSTKNILESKSFINLPFMVISGSFSIAENAEKQVVKLKKLGFKEAYVANFASTKYKSVCVKNCKTEKDALTLVKELKQKYNIDAYRHLKRLK